MFLQSQDDVAILVILKRSFILHVERFGYDHHKNAIKSIIPRLKPNCTQRGSSDRSELSHYLGD